MELYTKNMDVKKQQAAISFCLQLEKQPEETYKLLLQEYDGQCLSRPTVKIWYKLYSEGRTKVGAGLPGSTKRTVVTEAAAIQENCHLSTRRLESMLDTPKSTLMWLLIPNKELLISYFNFIFWQGYPLHTLAKSVSLVVKLTLRPRFALYRFVLNHWTHLLWKNSDTVRRSWVRCVVLLLSGQPL